MSLLQPFLTYNNPHLSAILRDFFFAHLLPTSSHLFSTPLSLAFFFLFLSPLTCSPFALFFHLPLGFSHVCPLFTLLSAIYLPVSSFSSQPACTHSHSSFPSSSPSFSCKFSFSTVGQTREDKMKKKPASTCEGIAIYNQSVSVTLDGKHAYTPEKQHMSKRIYRSALSQH